jgi:cytochrome c peroxidase
VSGSPRSPKARSNHIVLPAPYGRDGSIDSLADVVRHYSGIDRLRLHAKDGQAGKPLDLTQREQSDVVVFPESLSTFTNGWRPEEKDRFQRDQAGRR